MSDPTQEYASDMDSHSEVCGCAEANHEQEWRRERECGCAIVDNCIHNQVASQVAQIAALGAEMARLKDEIDIQTGILKQFFVEHDLAPFIALAKAAEEYRLSFKAMLEHGDYLAPRERDPSEIVDEKQNVMFERLAHPVVQLVVQK